MRIRAIVATLVIGSGMNAFAQAPDEMNGDPKGPPPAGDGDRMRPGRDAMKRRFMESLPPEVRKRFEAAREKALQDPKLQELRKKSEDANREFFEAIRAKMQEIDPGLAELIKDHAPPGGPGDRKDWKDRDGKKDDKDGKDGKYGRQGPPDGGMATLTDAEKEQLTKARATAKTDPAVVAAQKKKDDAADPEARRAAMEEYRAAMHTAMLKADPTIEPVLKKLGPPQGAPQPPPPSEGGMGGQMGSDPE